MNPFNKVEAIGIFISIAIMAVALGVIRFQSDTFALGDSFSENQAAVVAVGTENDEDAELERALVDASSEEGVLQELVIDDVRIGTGAGVAEGDTVTVHYIGTTQDGVRFDSSYERGEPYSFKVGAGRVIPGWEEGIIGMKAGGQRILVIPPDKAYGNRQVGSIPPNSPLVFAVELMEIR